MAAMSLPADFEGRCKFITQEQRQVISTLALRSRRLGRALDSTDDPTLLDRLDALLNALESEVEMTPAFRSGTKIDEGLKLMLHGPGFHFSLAHKEKAQKLLDKWESENWGRRQAPTPPRSGDGEPSPGKRRISSDEEGPSSPARRQRLSVGSLAASASSSGRNYLRPPPDHPIWGRNGIMHGIVLKRDSARRVYLPNPEYVRRDARVFGHNGIPVGQWYPYQICAWFHGAHGSKDAGIAGDPVNGAYSVVVAGKYDDLDTDRGYILYYSGSGSHENEDSNRIAPSSHGTKALQKSLATGNPVRVLRASSGKSRWAPTDGVRYDGLYQVVRSRTPRNSKGGLYEQFELERIEDGQQPRLEDYKNSRPNRQERSDFERISLGYRDAPTVYGDDDDDVEDA